MTRTFSAKARVESASDESFDPEKQQQVSRMGGVEAGSLFMNAPSVAMTGSPNRRQLGRRVGNKRTLIDCRFVSSSSGRRSYIVYIVLSGLQAKMATKLAAQLRELQSRYSAIRTLAASGSKCLRKNGFPRPVAVRATHPLIKYPFPFSFTHQISRAFPSTTCCPLLFLIVRGAATRPRGLEGLAIEEIVARHSPNGPLPPELSMYAEYLSNLEQVNVTATLPSPPDSSTKARVAADGLTLQLLHGGASAQLGLPAAVSGPSALAILDRGDHVLTWPLGVRARPAGDVGQEVPWLSRGPGRRVAGKMSTVRRRRGVGREPPRLGGSPSDNWAEMMEFWHCHKPGHNHAGRAENLETEGYGESFSIAAQGRQRIP